MVWEEEFPHDHLVLLVASDAVHKKLERDLRQKDNGFLHFILFHIHPIAAADHNVMRL